MKTYIEKCLRRTVKMEENTDLLKKLPLKYKGNYDLYSIFLDRIEWIVMQPKSALRLNNLRHDRKQVEKVSGLNCALFFTKLSYYSKETMMNEGIPFIIADKQMFLPFLGMLLSEKENRKLAPVHTISFLTQKLLLCALYEKWENMNVTKIAEKLGVTKMSVSRCLDEIEYLDIEILDTVEKTRKITINDKTEVLWEKIKPILRNPVIAKYELEKDMKLGKKAGISALCEYTLLADNNYPTYGITKKDLKDLNLKSVRQVSREEEKGCVILELGYFIEFRGENIEDPLSVVLSLSEEEMQEERVRISVDEMLEEYVW